MKSDRCKHGVLRPHECKACADEPNKDEIAAWARSEGLGTGSVADAPYAYLVVQASGFIVGGWKDRETAEKIAEQQLARDSERVVEVWTRPPRRELSEEDAMVERAWQRFCAHVALTDDEILAMWVGGPVTRPVAGRSKVLRFARDIARAVLSKAGHAGRRELSEEEIAACLPGAEPFYGLVGSDEILKFARAVLRAAGQTRRQELSEEVEAVIACLEDDAAMLRDQIADSEVAANMEKAAKLLRAAGGERG